MRKQLLLLRYHTAPKYKHIVDEVEVLIDDLAKGGEANDND